MLWTSLYLGWIVLELLIAILTRTRRGKGDIQDRGTMLFLWLTIAFSMTLSGFAQYMFPTTFPLSVRYFAISLLIAGLIVRVFSVISLGRAFSANVAIRDTQTLNQSGIYKLIRHPSYLGLIAIFLAVGLHSGNFVGLASAFVPSTAMLMYRIHVEEGALRAAFGASYEAYMNRTKRLIPWIY